MINLKLLSVFEPVWYALYIYIYIYIDGTVRDRGTYNKDAFVCVRDIHTDLGHISRLRGSGDDDAAAAPSKK